LFKFYQEHQAVVGVPSLMNNLECFRRFSTRFLSQTELGSDIRLNEMWPMSSKVLQVPETVSLGTVSEESLELEPVVNLDTEPLGMI